MKGWMLLSALGILAHIPHCTVALPQQNVIRVGQRRGTTARTTTTTTEYEGMFHGKPYKLRECYQDSIPRTIGTLEDNKANNDKVAKLLKDPYRERIDPIQKCYKAAKILKYKYFAVQDGGQCFSDASMISEEKAIEAANKTGYSTECFSDGEGGPMANQLYEIR